MHERMLPHHFAISQSTYIMHIQSWYDNITLEVPPQVQAVMQLADQHGQFPCFWELDYLMNRPLVLQFNGGYSNRGLRSMRTHQWTWLQDTDVQDEPTDHASNACIHHITWASGLRETCCLVTLDNSENKCNTSVNPNFACILREVMLMATEKIMTLANIRDPNIWIADSGASMHTTPYKLGMAGMTTVVSEIDVATGPVAKQVQVGYLTGHVVKQDRVTSPTIKLQNVTDLPTGRHNLWSISKMLHDE